MSKPTIESAIEQTEELLKNLKALAGTEGADEASEALEIPEPSEIAELEKADVIKLGAQLGISSDDVPLKKLKALLTTAASIFHGEDVEDEDEVTSLAEALGLTASPKVAKTIASIKKFLEAEKDSSDADDSDADSSDDADDEKPAKKKKKASDDDDGDEDDGDDAGTSDDDDDDDKPAKKKKKPSEDDDDDDAKDEDSDDDDKDDKDDDDDEDDKDDDDDEEEVSPKEQKKRVEAYNKHAKKPVKDYATLLTKIVDEDGDAVAWGKPYVKGETAYCCGLPLKDTKHDGEDAGKCLVTGKIFVQNENDELVEAE